MDFKKISAPNSTITRDQASLDKNTGNLYQSLVAVSKRANQIERKLKEELDDKLMEFSSSVDNLEEIFENREQIEISKFYERLPKPSIIAIEEFLSDKVYYRKPELEPTQEN